MKNLLTKILFILLLSSTGTVTPIQENSLQRQKDDANWLLRARIAAVIGVIVGAKFGGELLFVALQKRLGLEAARGIGAMLGLGASQAVIGVAGGPADASADAGTETGLVLGAITGAIIGGKVEIEKEREIVIPGLCRSRIDGFDREVIDYLPDEVAIEKEEVIGRGKVIGIGLGVGALAGARLGEVIGKIGHKEGVKAREQVSKIYYRFTQRDQKEENNN